MATSTSKLDRVSELRKRMGFPADASRWMLVMLILALPAMLIWRHQVGSRMVSLFRLLAMSALMLLWCGIACVIIAAGDWDLQSALFAVVCKAECGIAMLGTLHRAIRWIMYQRGEKLSTRSPGISQFSRVIPNANAERYLDPLLTIAAGLLMCSPAMPLAVHAPGSWLVLSGVALYAVESYMHGIQLDQLDGLLRAEAHEQATARFYNHSNEPAAASSSTTKVATGVDADLQASIARRQQRRAQSAGPTDEKPTSVAPPMPQAAADGEQPTFRAATEKLFATEQPSSTTRHHDAAPKEMSRAAAKEKADSERAKRNKLGAAIGIAVALGTMAAPSLKAGFATLVAPRAVPNAETADESLDASEMFQRAENYREGKAGFAKDEARAIRLYFMAAARGELSSQIKLGYLYELGEGGLPQSDKDAVVWYQRALAQHSRSAASNLGNMYLRGRGGLPLNEAEAIRLFRMAADAGSPEGEFNLAVMYGAGRGGLPKSEAEATKWYRQAADQGFKDAQTQLGDLYYAGEGGLPKNENEAAKWYRLAADQGEPSAQFYLGLMYQIGSGGLEQSPADAVLWLRKAALQEHGAAQVWLGRAYEAGTGGLPKSKEEAFKWYRKAAANGDEEAKLYLEVGEKQPDLVLPTSASEPRE